MRTDTDGWMCDCGTEYIHIGRGVFSCPNCGDEICLGEPEDWPEHGDLDISQDEVCRTCGGEYPYCKESCSIFQ